ncbi:MAG: DUF721 domain-containing protein [Beijerinckiaceae bacterium]
MQAPDRPRQRSWSRPLADLVGAAIGPVLARQGFGESDLIFYWDDIVGERLAAMSEPIKLRWPPRGTGRHHESHEPATLVVRVESGFALEMQHLTGTVIERINAHLGWNCVGRIALKQGPLQRRGAGKEPRRPPSAALRAAAEAQVSGIDEAGLRQALARLGAHVLAQTSQRGPI